MRRESEFGTEKARDAAWRILQGAKDIRSGAQAERLDMLAFLIEHVVHEANAIVERISGFDAAG